MGHTRRSTPTCLYTILLLACLSIQVLAASAVLGLDIGTEYIKGALVKPGIPLEIVLTKDSRRKEAAALAFKPSTSGSFSGSTYPERLYGADALALAPRYPADVYPNLKPLLGSLADTEAASQSFAHRYPAIELVSNDHGHSVRSQSAGKDQESFTIEELLSMQIKSMRTNAETMAGKGYSVIDAVVTVPAFYTVDERRAVQQAVELAGMRVMSLVSDGLAVGLNYATSRKFPNVDDGETPEYHLIYDMGAGSTTATVIRFQARKVKSFGKTNKTSQEVSVMGTGWDRSLGGDALNQLIADDMLLKFVDSKAAKSAGVTLEAVSKHGRATAKIIREAEKMRMVLSANQQTSSSFEGLFEDIDFKYKLTRTEFEDMATAFRQRLDSPITEALAKSKLSISDINSVVLHGGAVRTPFVQKNLESVAGDASKLRSNVNADEAAVFGAAFRAASLSPSFRVKEIKTDDVANYPVSITWNADGKQRKQNIFLPTSSVGTIKQLPINFQTDFELTLSQLVGEEERFVTNVQISNLTSSLGELAKTYSCAKDAIKSQLSIRLDPITGLPEVSEGSVSCEYNPADKKESVVDGVKNLFGWGNKGQDAQVPFGENETAEEPSSVSAKPSASGSKDSGKSATPKKKVANIPLAIQSKRTDRMVQPDTALTKIQSRLAAFDRSDELRALRNETFNILEGLTYRVRDMLTDNSIIEVSSKVQRDALEKLLGTTSDWLYGDGASATLDTIKEKLEGLEDLITPIRLRKDERTRRPSAIEALQSALNSTSGMTKVIQGSIERAAEASASAKASAESVASSIAAAATEAVNEGGDDLEDEEASTSTAAPSRTWLPSPYTKYDLEDLESLYESTKEWLEEQVKKQDKLSPSDVPILLSEEIERRTRQLSETTARLLSKRPKPQPKPKPSSKAKPKKPQTTSQTASVPVEETPVAEPVESPPSEATRGDEEPVNEKHDEL